VRQKYWFRLPCRSTPDALAKEGEFAGGRRSVHLQAKEKDVNRLLVTLIGSLVLSMLGTGAVAAAPSPDDGPAGGASGPVTILPTPLFALGEVDLSTLGVSPLELAAVGPAVVTASAGDGPNMFIVDDDRLQCPNAAFVTIQSAVAAAGPGDQIKVCAGLYPEQVRIATPGLMLFSEVPLAAVIQAPITMTPPKSIVTVDGATDVTIRQFTIQGPYADVPGCSDALPDRHTGVRIIDASATLLGNHITAIKDVNPALGGCQDGIAVQVGRRAEAQTGSAEIRNNLVDDYQKGGVVVDGPDAYAWVTQNVIDGGGETAVIARNGVQVGREASADVDHNVVRNNLFVRAGSNDSASGILLFETDAHVSTDHNDLERNGIGIAVFEGAIGLLIDHNDVHQSLNGGIAAFTGSAGNTISYNKATGNLPVDCYDETFGPGTAGTANFWIKDMGDTQNRPGLCKGATTTP
jgi:hypothetical protein